MSNAPEQEWTEKDDPDPFAVFSEWAETADDEAYSDL
jgi:hypothetical protein